MIYEALLVPHERPITLREIKRGLLTYDKVILIEPDDRDIMPSNAFMSTIMGIPLLGIDMGPIRPMGKVVGYDKGFSKTLDICRQATKEGLIEVRSTYTKEGAGQFTLGRVLTGGYPLNTQFVFWLYRAMATNQAFLHDAIVNGIALKQLRADSDLVVEGRGDGSINNIPALPLLEGEAKKEEEVVPLTQIARARLGAFVKYSGYCEAKDLVPVFPSAIYGAIVSRLLNNTQETLAEVDEDRFWGKRNRVLELCHEEFLLDSRLDEISVAEVLRLRTTAWCQQAEAREKLFEAVFMIANELGDKPDFEDRAGNAIREYRKSSEELLREREKFGFQLKCELGTAALLGGTSLVGLMSQLESPLASIGLTLAAGGVWALDRAKEYVPALRELRAKEREVKRGAGFGLHDFYSRIPKKDI